MKTIPPLNEQLAALLGSIVAAKATGKTVTRVELPSDLHAHMLGTMKKGMAMPAGIVENANLLPGQPMLELR